VTLVIFYLSFMTHDKINSHFRFDVPSITTFNHRIDSDGKYIFRSWQTYKGGVTQNKFNGYGVLTFKDGDVYSGQFTNGMMHGHGEITSSNLYMKYSLPNNTMYHSLISKYTGDVNGNMMHGWAKVVFDNGDVYTGTINGNCIHGYGTMIYKDGNNYTGDFNNGRYYIMVR
jgi:hypothetical protein